MSSLLRRAVLALCVCSLSAGAQDRPALEISSWEAIVVDGDSPETWPAGPWEPVDAASFAEFRESILRPGAEVPPEVYPVSARYEGVLDGDTLNGEVRFDIRRSTNASSATLQLSPLNLMVDALTWSSQPAVWGTDSRGRVAVVDNPAESVLTGQWQITGTRANRRLVFDLQLPRVAVGELVLSLPADIVPQCPKGVITESPADGPGAMRLWHVKLGRDSRIQLILEPEPETPPPAAAQVREHLILTAQAAALDVQLDLEVDGPIAGPLELTVARDFAVSQVSWGSDAAPPFEMIPQAGWNRLVIQVPEELPQRGGRLRLRGQQSLVLGQSQTPWIPRVEGRTVVAHDLTLHVREPLQLRSVVPLGYRLVDERAAVSGVESWNFDALVSRPALTLEIAAPAAAVDVDVVTAIDCRPPIPEARIRLVTTCRAGVVYEVRGTLPATWNVVSIKPVRGAAESTLAGFETDDTARPGTRSVVASLREGLHPGDRIELELLVMHAPLGPGQPLIAPVWRPVDGLLTGCIWAMIPPPGHTILSSRGLPSDSIPAERLEKLAPLDIDLSLPETVVVDESALTAGPGRRVLRFEPTTSERDIARRTDSSSHLAPQGVTGTTPAPIAARVAIETRLAPAADSVHQHRVQYELARDFHGAIDFQLPLPAVPRAVVADGDSLPLARFADRVTCPTLNEAVRSVEIVYETPAMLERMADRLVIPLPQWADVVGPVEWQIESPGTVVCAGLDSPFFRRLEEPAASWLDRIRGPLSRDHYGAEIDAPATTLGLWRFQGATLPRSAHLRVWNRARADAWAWVSMMGTLLGVLVLRRARTARLAIPFLLGAFLYLAVTVNEPDSQLFGAGLIAMVIGVAVPRQLLLRSSRSAGLHQVPRVTGGFRTTVIEGYGILLGLLAGGWTLTAAGQDVRSSPEASNPGERPTVTFLQPQRSGVFTGEVWLDAETLAAFRQWESRQPSPRDWFLRRAAYELLLGDEHQFRATFDVVVPDSPQPVVVELPFRNVAFSHPADAQVDDETAQLIPAPRGEGVLVTIPAAVSSAAPATSGPSHWRAHRVEFVGTLISEESTSGVDIEVPPVTSATVRFFWPGARPSRFRCPARGPIVAADDGQSILVNLGDHRRIAATWGTTDPTAESSRPASPLSDPVTVLTLHPLRAEGQSLLTLPAPLHNPGLWRISLPLAATIKSVTCDRDLKWEQVWNSDLSELIIESDSGRDRPLGLTVTFDLARPIDDPTPEQYRLERVWRSDWWQAEWIGLRSSPGESLEVLVPAAGATSPRAVEEEDWLATLAGRRLEAPILRYRFLGTETLAVSRTPRATSRSGDLTGTLRIGRDSVELSADLAVSMTGPAVPFHELSLDPRLEVLDARVEQDGADRLSRLVRDGETVRLFLSRPHGGMQTIRLKCRLRTVPGVESPVPWIRWADGTGLAGRWSIVNDSGWQVVLISASGEHPLDPTPADTASQPIRFSQGDAGSPTSFRVHPGIDAASARLVTRIQRTEAGWEQVTTASVRAVDAPLSAMTVVTPESMREGLVIEPRQVVSSQVVRSDGQLELHLQTETLELSGGRFSIRTPLTIPAEIEGALSMWHLPLPRMTTALTKERWLLLDPEFPLRPTSASATALRAAQIPGDIRAAATVFNAYRLTSDHCDWSAYHPDRSRLQIPLVESLVWVDKAYGLRGQTRLTVVSDGAAELQLAMPHDVVPDAPILEGKRLESQLASGRMSVLIPEELAGSLLTIDWHIDDPRAARLPALDLPRPMTEQVRHVAWVIPAGSGPRENSSVDLRVRCETTAGLLDAVRQQTSRSLGIDSPLIRRLRDNVARLESELATGSPPMPLRERIEQLLREWDAVRAVIVIAVDPPGGRQSGPPDHTGSIPVLEGSGAVGFVLANGHSAVSLQNAGNRSAQRIALGTGAAVVLLVLLLLTRRKWLALGDWFADRPAIGCLVLGAFWIAFLEPQGAGVIAILFGVMLLGRRSDAGLAADTAVVEPPAHATGGGE